MFSIVTVESSTKMPTASASPPSVMVLSVSPRKYSTTSDDRIASGIEIITTSVERHEPRNTRIINAVRPAAIAPSRNTPSTELVTNTDWSNSSLILRPGGAAARIAPSACFTPLTTASVEALPFLITLSSTERWPFSRTMFCCTSYPSWTCADVLHEDRRAIDELDRDLVEVVDRRRRRVGAHRILGVADLRRAGRQGQVLRIDGIDDVERGQAPREQLLRVDVHHDLAILAAGRRRQRDARNRRQLLPDPVDAVVVELLLAETYPS